MRSIPIVTRNLLIINVVAFLAAKLFAGLDVTNYMFGLHYIEDPNFHLFQLVTYMFMHGSWEHIFFNMFALWMFGCVVEKAWGTRRFLVYYLVCGVGAGLIQEVAQFVAWNYAQSSPGLTVGASGAIYAILLAFGMTWPENKIFIFPLPIPIKAKWFVCIYAAIELFLALNTTRDGVAHVAHLGGMIFGFLLIRHWQNGGQLGMNFDVSGLFKNRTRKDRNQAHDERNKDWRYNEEKFSREEIIDRILDKVRRNGYDSLTDEEKRTLFEK